MIVAYGDLHLGTERSWSEEVSRRIINYLVNNPLNTKDNTLILTGDITDKNILDGKAISLLHNLFTNLNYKHTYICMGNHEGRIREGKINLTYDFLEEGDFSSSFSIIKEIKEIEIEEKKVLFLPHVYSTGTTSLQEAYSSIPESVTNKKYDIIVGHVTDSRLDFMSNDKVDISKLESSIRLMGHIHSGKFLEYGYLGSIVPNSISETEDPRYYATIDSSLHTYSIPSILKYRTITYPEDVEIDNNIINVWTINNCIDEVQAQSKYGDAIKYIRKISYSPVSDYSEFRDMVQSASDIKSNYLEEWITSNKTKISESTVKLLRHYSLAE